MKLKNRDMKQVRIGLLFLLPVVVLMHISSCVQDTKKHEDVVKQRLETGAADTTNSKLIKLNNSLFSIPSPYQVAIFINENGLSYSRDNLSDYNKASAYSTSFSSAVNLGVYGSNMAYITLYEQTRDAMNYFSVIKMLAEKLELLAAFDKRTITRLENNISNKDSLMMILGNTYRNADAYFKTSQREHLACLVLAGGWVESMHLLVRIDNSDVQSVKKRIGENKKPLDNLIQLLAPHTDNSEDYKKLVAMLIDLAGIYEKVEVSYEFIEAVTDPDTKLTTVKSKAVVKMDDPIFRDITDKIIAIRNFIVS